MKKYLIGTSGWVYDHWYGSFYPNNTKKSKLLGYYSGKFDTVEINNTFYQLPNKKTFKDWYENTSKDFIFSVKASRYITHMKKLKDPEEPLERLYKGIEVLDEKLGIILFQLPPNWNVDTNRLRDFISSLSYDHEYAIEFRNDTWYNDEIYDILENNNITMVIHDHKDGASPLKRTSKNLYLRLHGPNGDYSGSYSKEQLTEWIDEIGRTGPFKRAYVCFNNDAKGNAVNNVWLLKDILNS